MMDALILARMQFAANITFHILFPTISISLGWVLLFFRWRWLKTHDGAWLTAYRYWTKVFALTFALGVVSGITMSFQFGTNWPGFMERVGNIAGPLLGYEVLTAFFLEATFLGVMLFGRDRVSDGMHTLATFLVAAGTTLSAFWILALNSWMQTPAGFTLIDGVVHPTDWWAVIFNPSFPYRLVHMLLAAVGMVTLTSIGVDTALVPFLVDEAGGRLVAPAPEPDGHLADLGAVDDAVDRLLMNDFARFDVDKLDVRDDLRRAGVHVRRPVRHHLRLRDGCVGAADPAGAADRRHRAWSSSPPPKGATPCG